MDDYYVYASAIVFITLISLITSIIQTRKSILGLQKIALRNVTIRVLRKEVWESIDSAEIVPGDLIEIPETQEMPCDAVLITGTCIVDEATLTGESIPVIKESLPHLTAHLYNIETDKQNSLYEGTKVIQTRSHNQHLVSGIVTRTGYSTMKGKMIRSILYPRPNKFKFYEDSIKFIMVLGFISLLGFIACLPVLILKGVPTKQVLIRCLDLFTVAVPPALPACMTIGIAFSISRMKKQNIFCINPERVNVAGKIDIFCFDKTGTLTEDGMDLLGIQPNLNNSIDMMYNDSRNIERIETKIIECMASCHSLIIVNDKMLGDSQDVQIFNFTR